MTVSSVVCCCHFVSSADLFLPAFILALKTSNLLKKMAEEVAKLERDNTMVATAKVLQL